ncbi:helix-hairpin-helix domain-containing protein [Nonlabens ponticola]|uniref:Competence protein ComEA n=1 Tax=Nonlabens ponticola TaxID=2496866 RepID=A0A3S9MWQ0_9FLAO|nr:helix-hairpin-helix domain-containing protein [Nonlabens ponticola]AZQ43645.1 competence protein ComEA [Nonlabens ponticola]
MNKFKSLFLFHRRQQRGIFVLVIILVILLGFKWYQSQQPLEPLAIVDNSKFQKQVDSLKQIAARKRDTIYPFNPNYITDYRGYKLGLSVQELDRLSRFRESGDFINSTAQFQQVTQVNQQWLDSISPYFKFPAWVTQKSQPRYSNNYRAIKVMDINRATADDLKKVYGIGPALSGRIIKERERLGGFIDFMQVRGVYGLSDSTMIKVKESFTLSPKSGFKKMALNTATSDELLSVPYFNDYLVDALLKQRALRERFNNWDEVMLTSRFPQEKLSLIQLYLTLD